LAADSRIAIDPATPELEGIGRFLADRLKPATGLQLPVRPAAGAPMRGSILLTTAGADPQLGAEGYVLTVAPDTVSLVAHRPAGLFRGLQTIRQLLPRSRAQRSRAAPGRYLRRRSRTARASSGAARCWTSPGISSASPA
jgi:hexosaminidase